jgi:hypothetical protein
MPTPSKGGWGALYEIQERKKRERQVAPLSPDDPGRDATPAVTQPPSSLDPGRIVTPVAQGDPGPVSTPAPPPERPRPQGDPGRVTRGWTGVTNHLLDDVLPTLEPPDQVVLLRLYRLTRGHKQARCKVSVGKLIAKTRVKRTRLRESLALLKDRGYIRRLPDDVDNPDNYDRGMNIEMLLEGAEPGRVATPSAERPRSSGDPNKERQFKERGINATPSPEDLAEYERARKELEGK